MVMPASYLHRDKASDKVSIIACESIAREMAMVAGEKKLPFTMHVLGPQCHHNPMTIGSKINNMLGSFNKEKRAFIAAGKCFSCAGSNHPGAYRLMETNCASILIGGDREYKKIAAGSYFLTPHLLLHWKEYFLGRDDNAVLKQKSARRLEEWFNPIKRVIKINLYPACENENYLAEEFAGVINKPLLYYSGSLDLLKREYDNFCAALTE